MESDKSSSDDVENYKGLLEKHRVEVVQSLDLDRQFMLSYLRSNSVFDDEDCQLILNSGSSRQQKNAKFLDVISCRGVDAYKHFVDALEFEHCQLFKLFTGKEVAIEKNYDYNNLWSDYNREFLAKELTKLSEQYRALAYMQSKTLKEKQQMEKKLLETASELQSIKKYKEELEYELTIKEQTNEMEENQGHMELNSILQHCQALAQENSEKSNVIIALQARLLALNEEYEKRNQTQEDMVMKHKNLIQQVKELTVNYDFQRTESSRLRKKVDEKSNVLEEQVGSQREIHSLKFQLSRVTEERDELRVKLDEFKNVVTALNAKLSLLQEERDNETEKRGELSEEYFKTRHQLKTFELEKNQLKNSVEFFKERSWRYCEDINTHKEQVSFLTSQVKNTIDERNRVMRERDNVIKYNTELLKSRDETLQNQIEISDQFERRYREVSKQLDEAKQELRDMMIQHVRSNSSVEDHNRADLFETELKTSRKVLERQQSITLTPDSKDQQKILKPNVKTNIKIEMTRTDSQRLLDSAYESLTEQGRRKSAPADFSLSNKQLAMVYESLQGKSLPFTAVLGNLSLFSQFDDDDQESVDKRKRRFGIHRKSDKNGKNKRNINDALTSICPMLSPTSPVRSRSNKM